MDSIGTMPMSAISSDIRSLRPKLKKLLPACTSLPLLSRLMEKSDGSFSGKRHPDVTLWWYSRFDATSFAQSRHTE